MSMVAEKSKEYLLEILSKGKSIADDEFIIMDEKEVDDFIRMEKLRIKMPRDRNVLGNRTHLLLSDFFGKTESPGGGSL